MILTDTLLNKSVNSSLDHFWKDLVSFLRRSTKKICKVVNGVVYGCNVSIQKSDERVKIISRYYSKVDEHWEETVITWTHSESDIPKEIIERLKSEQELDITDELEMKLA